jgi:LCP family protein required for cell wall assembly
MSETSTQDFFVQQAREARGPQPHRPRKKKHRLRRIIIAAGLSVVLLAGLAVGGAYFAVNHVLSGIHRIQGITALDAANQPVMPLATRRSMTVLLTGSEAEPSVVGGTGADGSSQAPEDASGLIALVHLDANQAGGAVVSIPANAVVPIPGHGRQELWDALTLGGPSLLIETVEDLTNVRINHYSVVDFPGVVQVISALRGVNVDVPYTTTSDGYTFTRGIDHLNAADVLPYVRQPDVSEIGRELLQQNLIRTMLDKIAHQHMFSATDWAVLNAMAGALSVDSNFTNGELEHLALRLGYLSSGDGTFVTAPTNGSAQLGGTSPVHLNPRISRLLWYAIRHDEVAAFARRFPFTVTPTDPG